MNNNTLGAGAIGVIIGILLSMFVFPSNMMNWRYGGQMMGPNLMGNMDEHFIDQMIPHHKDAITMAEIALEKSQRPEIRNLAQDIIRTQTAEIEQMNKWKQDWFGDEILLIPHVQAHGMMHMGMMGDSTDIDRLENAEPFDKAFIKEMIPHHQMAVMMAQMLERTTDRSEMKKLAADIISAQTKEINQMRQWYRQWYQSED